MKIQIKRTIAILLLVCFLVSVTAAAADAAPGPKENNGKGGHDGNDKRCHGHKPHCHHGERVVCQHGQWRCVPRSLKAKSPLPSMI